jgi:tricorn protease
MKHLILSLLAFLFVVPVTESQISARLFRYPDVSQTQIVFAYGGDLWVTDKAGGTASRLSSPSGEEAFPRFSPDGSTIAFSGNYDGNMDIYTIPNKGGVPTRVTHHGMTDRIIDWYPDGKSLLYASSGESGKQRFSQFYKISAGGGLPEKLPTAYGEYASLSPDGKRLAFTEKSRIFRTWKRYRGGMNSDIIIFDLETYASTNITNNDANDEIPMWHGEKVYYLSDAGDDMRYNIWMYDMKSEKNQQITTFSEFDVHFPAMGPQEIVFEVGGNLYLLDLKTHKQREVKVDVVTDLMAVKPRVESAEKYVMNMAISPDGNRALVEARGEVFSLPAEKGYVQNMTRTAGVAERFPAWSPDGKQVAYWSDRTGEYELTVRDMTQGGKETTLTSLGAGFRYNLYWSPDSKKIAFVDQTMTIQTYDFTANKVTRVDQDISLFEGGLRGWRPTWSSDSQWMAYSKSQENGNGAIMIYNTKTAKLTQATSGFYSDLGPAFDPEGNYLYILTNRSFEPEYSDFDNTWIYPNATQIAAIALRSDVPSPLSAENDTVAIASVEDKKDEDKKEDGAKSKSKDKSAKDATADSGDEDSKAEKKEVKIDFQNFERRLVILPPKAGNIGGITAVDGKLAFVRVPNTGTAEGKNVLKYYDLKDREEKTIIEDINGFVLSADGKKILVNKGGNHSIIDFGADQKAEHSLAMSEMEMTVEPRAEWKQIFNDAWRFQRDFFYDNEMHGVDWNAMRTQYGALIDYCVNRTDVNFVIGELIGELNASHTYHRGGDNEDTKRRAVGYLGIDWEKKNDHFVVKTIIRGADWDNEVRSPLDEPGVNVKEGEYILAVNGIPLNEYTDPWAAFEGLSNKTVELTVNTTSAWKGSRTVVVKTLSDETRLRNLAWIESNRKRVDEASGGKIGYIYVPSTGRDGQNELVRQFYGQWNKEGLIVDERFNNGGQIPDRFVELLNRKPLAYFDVRDGQNWQWPPVGHFGSMAMLINGWSGSGGDAFPDFFRKSGLGPLIGTRTWGGLIGLSGSPQLIDGGAVTVPTFRQYNPDGSWFKEGHGVDPDIEVKEDPTALAKGIDPQLERAIQEVMKSIGAHGPINPPVPAKENRARPGKT